MDEVLRPYHHTAPVAGRQTTFAMLEYPRDKPPTVVQVDENAWVRLSELPTSLADELRERFNLDQ